MPEDHAWIVRVVDDWWGRPIADAIPRASENRQSIAFHRRMGFDVTPVIEGYNRPGH